MTARRRRRPIASVTIFESSKLCEGTSAEDGATKALQPEHFHAAKTMKLKPLLQILFRSQSIKLGFPNDAQPIKIHGGDQDHADDNLLDKRAYSHDVQTEANRSHGQCADNCATDVTAPTHKARTADPHGGDRVQLVSEANARVSRINARGEYDRRNSD